MAGVRLDQYAGVTAALAEGIAPGEVLAQERIAEPSWPAADRAWRETLVEAPDLQLRYLRLRRQAEDCLSRRVEPLEDDAAAWAGLLGALALADDPDRILQSLGLRMTDIGRLGRSWSRKSEEDGAVVDQLTKLAGKAKPPSSVRCAPTVLRRFPWTPPPRDVVEPKAAAKPADAIPPVPEALGAEVAGRVEQVPSYLAALNHAARAEPAHAVRREPPAPEMTLDLSRGPARGAHPTLPFSAAPAAVPEPGLPSAPRVDTGTIDASSGPARDAAAGPVIRGLTLAQYASLSAELSVEPREAPAILAKYQIAGDEERKQIADAWNAVLLRDAKLRAEWMQLTAEFRAWLVQRRPPAG